jgi:sulfur-carrier protein
MNVSFSGTLLRFVNFQKNVNLEAHSVNEALSALIDRFPQVKAVLYDAEGKVRQVHQIFVNGQQFGPEEFGKPLTSTDRLDVLTAIAGG